MKYDDKVVPIGRAPLERRGTVSGSVGVSRGAPQGQGVEPKHASLEGADGPQVSSRSTATGMNSETMETTSPRGKLLTGNFKEREEIKKDSTHIKHE